MRSEKITLLNIRGTGVVDKREYEEVNIINIMIPVFRMALKSVAKKNVHFIETIFFTHSFQISFTEGNTTKRLEIVKLCRFLLLGRTFESSLR